MLGIGRTLIHNISTDQGESGSQIQNCKALGCTTAGGTGQCWKVPSHSHGDMFPAHTCEEGAHLPRSTLLCLPPPVLSSLLLPRSPSMPMRQRLAFPAQTLRSHAWQASGTAITNTQLKDLQCREPGRTEPGEFRSVGLLAAPAHGLSCSPSWLRGAAFHTPSTCKSTLLPTWLGDLFPYAH